MFFINLSLKLVANPVVISDQGLCEDFLRRASYIIHLKKGNNVMLSVNSVTKMLTKERKYSDRGSPWIYHSRTCCKKGNININDNILVSTKSS